MNTPITVLAKVSRGYATDKQCAAAIEREQELIAALLSAYEAMLSMRAMLSRHDVSMRGCPIEQTILQTAAILYPPTNT